ncbi:MAG: DNA primase [Chloroflexi bacterium]|nr:DNA primase [Chloroflexota bacterium]
MESSPVEQVRAAADVVRVISQHVPLKKAGRTFKGLCPFHSEKTPSFVLFPETGRWHCFGCGEGGDVFTFLMKIENLTFPEALRRLADEAGIPLGTFQGTTKDKSAYERLYAANEAAALFFHGLLLNTPSAHQYVANRGITDDTVRRFLLGVAPEGDDALQRHLARSGFTVDEMLSAGLLYQGENVPPRDRFRGRLMFPIKDAKGQIVSFGARALAPGAQPKYLNGPQTEIFDKGSTLYGLHAAIEAIRREHKAVVVEGYVDVVVTHQGGFENVVATLGTSMTERHVQELRRLAPEICLALDPDAAGQNASQRGGAIGPQAVPGIQVAAQSRGGPSVMNPGRLGAARPLLGFDRVSITVATLPDGKDPDEIVLRDPEEWRNAILQARPVMEQAIEWARERYDLQSLAGKREAADALLALLTEIADPISRAYYLELAARELHLESRALGEQLARLRRPSPRHRTAPGNEPASADRPTAPMQLYAIALTVEATQRGLAAPGFNSEQIFDPDARALFLRIQETLASAARSDWRPDPLGEIDEAWLTPILTRARELLPFTARLTDAEIASEATSVGLELRESQLAMELTELLTLADDPESDEGGRLKIRIAQKAQARAELIATSRGRSGDPHFATIPWKYRSSPEDVHA